MQALYTHVIYRYANELFES